MSTVEKTKRAMPSMRALGLFSLILRCRPPFPPVYILATVVSLISPPLSTSPARASVAFDPDRYGDKELKIATVNKLKQKLRNAIAGDLSLAVAFVRLAINDDKDPGEEGKKGGHVGGESCVGKKGVGMGRRWKCEGSAGVRDFSFFPPPHHALIPSYQVSATMPPRTREAQTAPSPSRWTGIRTRGSNRR